MPMPPDAIPRLRTTPGVCVCGYDLSGLPADAAAKCPECGVVIAEIEPPASRFHHCGRWLAIGMTPAILLIQIPLTGVLLPGAPGEHAITGYLLYLGIASWPLASVPAFVVLLKRATRARSVLARAGAAALAFPVSLLANALAIGVVAMPFG